MASKRYTSNGNVVRLNETKNGVPFFRKENPTMLELEIVRKLQRNPHPNIVKIYHVSPDYYDMELVSTRVTRRECIEQLAGLTSAKRHMQRLGIAYLDWKRDNCGLANGRVKVFDFDSSALVRRWPFFMTVKAPFIKGYSWRKAENQGLTDPFKIDDRIFAGFMRLPGSSSNSIFN